MKVLFAHTKDIDVQKILESNYISDEEYDALTRLKNVEVLKEKALSTYFKRKYVGEYHLNDFGKPISDNCFFNISHTKGLVVFVKDTVPVGIDVEGQRKIDNNLIKYVCSPEEEKYIKSDNDFYRIWTNKESLVKCLGTGIRTKVNEIPGLPLNDVRQLEKHIFKSETIEPLPFIISVTRESLEDFDIELVEERFAL